MAHNTHFNYMDGVKVKISEQYKPPRRINMGTSYSQRLMMNKQIQDNIPVYDFTLEERIQSRMKEWRQARSMMAEERTRRFEKCKLEKWIKVQERLKSERETGKNKEEEVKVADNTQKMSSSFELVAKNNHVYISQTTSASMLFPTQVATPYSNILMPTPLATINHQHIPKSTDKSPFNLSDFEADTSSPFDNMELKTLNDMEELAQVLKNDDVQHQQQQHNQNRQNYSYNMQHNQYYQSFQEPMASYSYTNSHLANLNKPFVQQMNYAGTNGYYGPTDVYNNFYSSKNNKDAVNQLPQASKGPSPSYNAVPNIIKSLENDLKKTQISSSRNTPEDNRIACAVQPAKDVLDDPYDSLSTEMQLLCRNVSSMGFPIPRVARACRKIGNDQKKLVEHLLVMSELLDLGFSEAQVSAVLLQCDNDRDKALDILIL